MLQPGKPNEASGSFVIAKEDEEDIDIMDDDIITGIQHDLPSIRFSERPYKLMEASMTNTVVLKLLGRNIGLNAFTNKVFALWRPSQPFMDLENDYFLSRFQSKEDYRKVLTDGSWIIYGQYLTVQPWSFNFSTSQPYPAWIRLPGLPEFMYKKFILMGMGKLIRKVVKLDFHKDTNNRRRFARIAVYVGLKQPLVSQVVIENEIQKVEYENHSQICFSYGRFGYMKEACPFTILEHTNGDITSTNLVSSPLPNNPHSTSFENSPVITNKSVEEELYGPWMVVVRQSL
ncbi:hypothetical protein F3Y22_tig00018968pilonHSYRG00003 [Hibiscus syriacus]|uniref:DUF4283 domain-containing protein n=1 Tax=Hibiscus syriacus TaxID=106335 RepID=A0A6A3BV93_HIBSY|nr:uncharacterized protein LOC120209473 [Hibiscus syriacus]KAE8720574.1 hypothetical protein F3Y22_tig00018968pilonHSYRG00003 [Hibiscus syriacus]